MQSKTKIMTAVLAVAVALMFLGAATVVPGDDESYAEEGDSLPLMPLKDTADMLLQMGAMNVTNIPEASDKVIYITDDITVNGDTPSYLGKTVVFQGADTADPLTITIADGYGLEADAIYFDGNVDIDFGKYSYFLAKSISLGAFSIVEDEIDSYYMISEGVVNLDVYVTTTIPAYIAATEEDRMNMSMTLDMDVSIQAHNDIVFFSEEYTGSGTTDTPDAVDGVVDETETIKDGTVNSKQLTLHPAEDLTLLDVDISADFTYFYRNIPEGVDNNDIPNILMWFNDNRVFPDIEGSFLLTDMSAFDYDCDGSVDFTVHTYTVNGVEAYSALSVDTVNYGDSHEVYVQNARGTFNTVNDTSSFQPMADISVDTLSYTSSSSTDMTTLKSIRENSVQFNFIEIKLTTESGGLAGNLDMKFDVVVTSIHTRDYTAEGAKDFHDTTAMEITDGHITILGDAGNLLPLAANVITSVKESAVTGEDPDTDTISLAEPYILAALDYIKDAGITASLSIEIGAKELTLNVHDEGSDETIDTELVLTDPAASFNISGDKVGMNIGAGAVSFTNSTTDTGSLTPDDSTALTATNPYVGGEVSVDDLQKIAALKTDDSTLETLGLSAVQAVLSGTVTVQDNFTITAKALSLSHTDSEGTGTAELGGLNILLEANSAEKVSLNASIDSITVDANVTETQTDGDVRNTLVGANAEALSLTLDTTVGGLSAVYDLMTSEDDSKTAASKFQASTADIGITVAFAFTNFNVNVKETTTKADNLTQEIDQHIVMVGESKVGFSVSANDGAVSLSAGTDWFNYTDSNTDYVKEAGEFVKDHEHTTDVSSAGVSLTASGKMSNAKYVLGYLMKESSKEKPDIEQSVIVASLMADTTLQIDASTDGFKYSDVRDGDEYDGLTVTLANPDAKSTGIVTVSANVTAKTSITGLRFSAYALLDTTSGTYLSILQDEYAVNWYRDGQNILVNNVDATVTANADVSITDLIAKGGDAFKSALSFEAILAGDVAVTEWATIGEQTDPSDNELYISEFVIEGISLTTSDPSMKTYTATADLVKFNRYCTPWNDYTGSVLELMDTLDGADLSIEAANLTLGDDVFYATSATISEKGSDAVNYVRGEAVQQIACYTNEEKKLFDPENGSNYVYADVQIVTLDPSLISTDKGLVIAIKAAPVTSEATTSDSGASVTIQATSDEEVILDSSALSALIAAVAEGKTATLTVDSAKDDGVSVTLEKATVTDLVGKNASLEIKASKGTLLLDATAVKTLSDATASSLNLTVSTVSETEIRAQVSAALADSVAGRTVISISNSSGVHKLNGKMTFTVPYELQDSSKTAKLLYLNTETNQLEEIECSYDAESKTVTGTVDHMSLFVIDETEPASDNGGDPGSKSNTGLYIGIGVGAVAIVALAGAAFFFVRKN